MVSALTLLPRALRLLWPDCPARRGAPCPAQRCRATAAWLHWPWLWSLGPAPRWLRAVPTLLGPRGLPWRLPAGLAPPVVIYPAVLLAMAELAVPGGVVALRPCEGLPLRRSPPVLSSCPSCGQRGSSGSSPSSPAAAKIKMGVRAALVSAAAPSQGGSSFPSRRFRVLGKWEGLVAAGDADKQAAAPGQGRELGGRQDGGWRIRQQYRRGAGSARGAEAARGGTGASRGSPNDPVCPSRVV